MCTLRFLAILFLVPLQSSTARIQARLDWIVRPNSEPMETALYLPVKRFLENLGFTVKGEVGGCDLVALSGDDPPIVVIGELKLSFNLELFLQAVDRAGACDEVWLAAKMSARGKGRESDARYRNLCRRLGFGMLARHQHRRRRGDRQAADDGPAPQSEEALAAGCRTSAPQGRSGAGRQHARADHDGLSPAGAGLRIGAVARAAAGARAAAEIPDAAKILLHNVYGWFDRAERGVYVLTDAGHAALKRWPQQPAGS